LHEFFGKEEAEEKNTNTFDFILVNGGIHLGTSGQFWTLLDT
jgi:hypothetical protein